MIIFPHAVRCRLSHPKLRSTVRAHSSIQIKSVPRTPLLEYLTIITATKYSPCSLDINKHLLSLILLYSVSFNIVLSKLLALFRISTSLIVIVGYAHSALLFIERQNILFISRSVSVILISSRVIFYRSE